MSSGERSICNHPIKNEDVLDTKILLQAIATEAGCVLFGFLF